VAVGAVTTVVAHVQAGFGSEAAVSRVEKDARRVLRVVAHVVESVQVGVLGTVASVKGAGVQRLHGDDTGAAVLETAHIARLAVGAAAGQALVAVGALATILVGLRVVFVRGAVGEETSLSTQVRVDVHTVRTNAEALAAQSANEARVGLVALGAALVGDGVDLVEERGGALVETALVGAVIIDSTSQ
jgi:hypothetical protein